MEYLFQNINRYNRENLDQLFKEQSEQIVKTKCLIDKCPNEWDKIKKVIHLYEYVYSTSYYRKNVSHIIPISRSFFKMTEMIDTYNLRNNKEKRVACLAEAPGGFIQAFLLDKSVKRIDAITLISDESKIPYWNKSLLKTDNIYFHKGVNQNGDLYDLKNVLSFINDIGKSKVDIVTGDGGFDYSSNYNDQEKDSLKLIFSEIFAAINIQKKGGTFICKIFDIFCEQTFQLLYLLSLSYNQISIYKPCISRLSNSEKYIVCKDFKGYNKEIVNKMVHHFEDNTFDNYIPEDFLNCIYGINEKYLKIQIEQINLGIRSIKQKARVYPSKIQIDMAIKWCTKYNIEINNDCMYLN